MKTCGILISKKTSRRFPGKNRLLFRKNAEILTECFGAHNVYMLTDDMEIHAICLKMGIEVIIKHINISDEMSYLDVLKFAYQSIPEKYDIIVTIVCSSIDHTKNDILKGLRKIENNPDVVEVRSFDCVGNQSGIFIFRADRLPEKWHHMAAFESNGREIHYKEEL